ncbi:isochorismate synthase [Aquimarina mytili]|uniref:isochorismate synthase n=1 Tax=Aquimarina mytili TaxID=874423 RepID=A0A937DA16_9FLAO|nr:isochorismate synthase [Aquimarina mytili]MBL0683098.1 isochorismate synthase [Aquimarina mytili]
MNVEDVYANIQEQLDQELPFVVYKKAAKNQLQCFLQQNDLWYELDDDFKSGFIFAPFDNAKKDVLIPLDKSVHYSVDITPGSIQKVNVFVDVEEDALDKQETKERHRLLVNKAIQNIKQGSIKKVVLSRKEEVKSPEANPLFIFKRLVEKYPKAFVYLWYHPKVGMWLGATPETLLDVQNDQFSTMALAGTQAYQSNGDATWDDKEIEEQEIVTEFIVKALSPISSNIISSKTYTHRAGTLLHLRTDIKGDLNSEVSEIENVIKVLHPTPAVCGLPKDEAKSFILRNEGYDRKFYTGFLGELNIQSDKKTTSNLFVNLRCMEIEDQNISLYIGGGITKDSDPDKEWEETVRKTATMKNVLF